MNYRIGFKYAVACWLMGIVLMTVPTSSLAQLQKEQVITALIYNFARFVTWPETSFPSSNDPLIIAAIGDGALQKELSSLEGKQVEGRTIVVKRVSFERALAPNLPHHILYIPQLPPRQLSSLMQAVAKKPVLTISTMQDFALKGGILHLQDTLHTISFSINLDSAEQADLIISSKLFPLATKVIKHGQTREGP
jgi:hypothetical protein